MSLPLLLTEVIYNTWKLIKNSIKLRYVTYFDGQWIEQIWFAKRKNIKWCLWTRFATLRKSDTVKQQIFMQIIQTTIYSAHQ